MKNYEAAQTALFLAIFIYETEVVSKIDMFISIISIIGIMIGVIRLVYVIFLKRD